MNCAVIKIDKESYIAAGENNRCQLYKVECCICSEDGILLNQHGNKLAPNFYLLFVMYRFQFLGTDENVQGTLRNRRKISNVNNHSTNGIIYNKSLTFQFSPYKSIETEFHWVKTEFQ